MDLGPVCSRWFLHGLQQRLRRRRGRPDETARRRQTDGDAAALVDVRRHAERGRHRGAHRAAGRPGAETARRHPRHRPFRGRAGPVRGDLWHLPASAEPARQRRSPGSATSPGSSSTRPIPTARGSSTRPCSAGKRRPPWTWATWASTRCSGAAGGIPNGGIMKPPSGAPAAWVPYALVKDAKAAATTAAANGGKIVNGPMEVPGGDWICTAHGSAGRDVRGALAESGTSAKATAAKPAAPEGRATEARRRRPGQARPRPRRRRPRRRAPPRRPQRAPPGRPRRRRAKARPVKKVAKRAKPAKKKAAKRKK